MELMVVLVVIGISAALVVPRFGASLDFLQHRSGLRAALGAMRQARAEAVFRGENILVLIDIEKGTLLIIREEDEKAEESDEDNSPEPEDETAVEDEERSVFRPKLIELPSSLEIKEVETGEYGGEEDEAARIVFYPLGTSSGGELLIEDSRGKEYLIRVGSLNGKARLTDVENED
jgi:type II secretory pathway pseudopilin PulG